MIQVVVSPQSVLETGITVEVVDNLRFFKFTDTLQDRLEGLLEKNKLGDLASLLTSTHYCWPSNDALFSD
jgi:hypothetical protein